MAPDAFIHAGFNAMKALELARTIPSTRGNI
jgi:hypothetical protein